MDTIQRLILLFEKFPGIGPRQAERFVQYLLRASPATRREIADAIQSLASSVRQCADCKRYFGGSGSRCGLCSDEHRDATTLAVVASDADVIALEKSGTYRGRYFVLGGTISLASETMNGLRMKELLVRVSAKPPEEIILAFPANPEGDATATRVREELNAAATGLRITTLGRGLSTGSELEYADPETIRNAIESRK